MVIALVCSTSLRSDAIRKKSHHPSKTPECYARSRSVDPSRPVSRCDSPAACRKTRPHVPQTSLTLSPHVWPATSSQAKNKNRLSLDVLALTHRELTTAVLLPPRSVPSAEPRHAEIFHPATCSMRHSVTDPKNTSRLNTSDATLCHRLRATLLKVLGCRNRSGRSFPLHTKLDFFSSS